MNFKMRFEDGATTFLPGVSSRNSGVELSESEMAIHLGKEFETCVDIGSIAQVRAIPNPEPQVILPLGISAAVQQFGSDTVAAIGSREGLVVLDFTRTLEAKTLTAAAASGEGPKTEQAPIGVSHLVLSLEDPEEFVTIVNERLTETRSLRTDAE